jgi:hypothetical protein
MPTSKPASDATERLETLLTRERAAASECPSGITGWGSSRRSFRRCTSLLTRLIKNGEPQMLTSVYDLVEDLRTNLRIDVNEQETDLEQDGLDT